MIGQVTVNKETLLKILRGNRDKHRAVFEEAMVNYRRVAIEELDSMIEEAKAGKRIRRSVDLVEPLDQTSEYDRAIRMLELSVDDEIDLDATSFSQLVLNVWHWTPQFKAANAAYVSSKANIDYLDSIL